MLFWTILGLIFVGAVVNAPLFSLSASGKLGDAIVYAVWKGRAYVRQYVIPANPRSIAQQIQRGMMKSLSQWWDEQITATQEMWTTLAQQYNISNFNAYVKTCITQMIEGSPPAADPETGPGLVTGILNDITGVGGFNTLEATVTITTELAATEMLIVTIGTKGGLVATSQAINRTIDARSGNETDDDFVVNLTDIPAGDYFLSANIVEAGGGTAGWTSTAAAVTVTGVA